jgi:hypothetical protein
MTMRRSRSCILPFLALALGAARAPVVVLPDTLVPDRSVTIGTKVSAKPGDVVLRAKIARTEKTYLDVPVHAEIARFAADIPAGAVLTTVLANDRTRSIVGSQADIYYCGDDMKARSSFMAGLMGDMGSKFENIVRFCFVDDDKDGRFDHYFLAGAKDPLFLKEQPVGPLPYRVEHLVQENAADEIRLKYRKFDTTTSKISLELEITRNGAALPFEYIITPTHTGRNEQYYRMASNPAKVPYPVVFEDVLGADIIIDRCNPTERRNFSCSAISPLAVQALQPERAIHFHLHLIAPPRCACAMRLWNWSTPPRTSGMSDTQQDAAKAAWDAAHVRAWLESRMAAAAQEQVYADRKGRDYRDDYDKAAAEGYVCGLARRSPVEEQASWRFSPRNWPRTTICWPG